MDPNEYSKRALVLDSNYPNVNDRLQHNEFLLKLMHGSIGLTGEAGEVADLVKKTLIYGRELDQEKLKKECGDVLWYMAVLLDAVGSSFNEVMEMNIEKLEKRYPNGFNEVRANAKKETE
jgi:NTP pyrophosphatase (non-canonical NTP hydrolase)